MTKDTPNDNKVIDFKERVKRITPETQNNQRDSEDKPLTNEQLLTLGTESFLQTLEDATGFITITFDETGQPEIIHAGNLDIIAATGTLEYAKNEILNNSFTMGDEDPFYYPEDYSND